MKSAFLLLLACASCAWGYIPNPADATGIHRTDYAGMQFLANQGIAAGIMTNAGNVWITADSSPIDAIQGAMTAWNGVSSSAARFLPLQMTSQSYNVTSANGVNIIVFADDGFTEAITNGVIAFTVTAYNHCTSGSTCSSNGTVVGDATIIDSNIFFSPFVVLSTTLAPGTYDLQSIMTHELGHALGANHTNILSATMYYSSGTQDNHAATLSADDAAFVSNLYPATAGTGYGNITGFTLLAGAPLLGAAIAAVDVSTGTTVGGFSSVVDGSYSLQVPPGNYMVYCEPAANFGLYLQPSSTFNIPSAFQAGFAGGNSQPSVIAVQAGGQAGAVLNATPGATPFTVPFTAVSTAGAIGDYTGSFYPASVNVSSGQAVDFLFTNPLTGTFTESNIQVIGAATIRAGTLRKDTITVSGGPVYRITLDIPPLSANSSATVVFTDGTNYLARSGLLNLTRPQAVNAASFLGGPVAPGEILSFFGSQLGPPSPVANSGFDANGLLPVSLGGIAVTFGQTAAPLFYVSGSQINLQVPYEVSGQTSALMTVSYNGAAMAKSMLSVGKSAPGIFVVTNADGSANGPNAPSPAGAVLVVYGTGAGITSGVLKTGAPAPANSTATAQVTIGGLPVTPIYAGLTPGSVGLTQVNVAIPAGTPPGNAIPLQISFGGNPAQTVNIAVQ